MKAPFEPAPVAVAIHSALAPEAVADALARAAAEERFLEPVGEDRGLLRLAGGVVADEVLLTAQRWATPEQKVRTPQPLTFRGHNLPGENGGASVTGEMVAPIAPVLWVVPSAAFAFGLIAGLDGNLVGIVGGPLLALLTVAVFRVNQWNTLRDAPQLERALRDLLRA